MNASLSKLRVLLFVTSIPVEKIKQLIRSEKILKGLQAKNVNELI